MRILLIEDDVIAARGISLAAVRTWNSAAVPIYTGQIRLTLICCICSDHSTCHDHDQFDGGTALY